MSEIYNKIENFEMIINEKFVEKAVQLEPKLYHRTVEGKSVVRLVSDGKDWIAVDRQPAWSVKRRPLKKGDRVCFDFEDHFVGYVTLHLKAAGSPPDAPAHIRIKLGEVPCEIAEESSSYQGAVSSSWIQEEFLHIDVLPAVIRMPRRYAFRYMELKVLDTSSKYQLVIEKAECETVTSADRSQISSLDPKLPEDLQKMDAVAIKTLEECMQDVFEDGPKRDRRLWIGDLRLQALTNYETFKNYDLVKRCLYLFAGLTQNEGHVGACLFVKPALQIDDTALFDYGLFFISCLYDYYRASGDGEILKELWDTAYHQAELAAQRLDENGVVIDSDDWWCFLDWNDELNKQAGAQGVFIYTVKQAVKIAEILNDNNKKSVLKKMLLRAETGAKKILWDEEQGFFVSGKNRQISWASQIWLVLADVFEKEKNVQILKRLMKRNPKVDMVTPYMYHHFVEALILNGMGETALSYMRNYWGKMVEEGADCYYELYDPSDKYRSPYGSRMIHSYCHAWSCTPSYFIRKYHQMWEKLNKMHNQL